MQRTPLQSFSTTEALDLLRQGSGSAYFVPSGYIPILVPDNDEDPDFIRRLLDTHVPTQVPVDNLWQTRLPTKVMRPKRKRPERVGPAKKPPRPPNAFILYRKDKQKSVQEREIGITNNEVSKVIGDMWKQETKEVKDHYQALAQQSREQHQKEYPGYKYAPRRPGERKRRGVQQEIVFGECETSSNADESLADIKSPSGYGASPTPNGDYFRFTSNAPYYPDMMGMPGTPDEFNISQIHPSQHTPCLTGSDVDNSWSTTPTRDVHSHTPELGLDAGHPELEYDNPNVYGMYTDNTFVREAVPFQSAPEHNYDYLHTPDPTAVNSPMHREQWQSAEALMVENIYGNPEWMHSPMSVNQNI
jgi:hypothetical protein